MFFGPLGDSTDQTIEVHKRSHDLEVLLAHPDDHGAHAIRRDSSLLLSQLRQRRLQQVTRRRDLAGKNLGRRLVASLAKANQPAKNRLDDDGSKFTSSCGRASST